MRGNCAIFTCFGVDLSIVDDFLPFDVVDLVVAHLGYVAGAAHFSSLHFISGFRKTIFRDLLLFSRKSHVASLTQSQLSPQVRKFSQDTCTKNLARQFENPETYYQGFHDHRQMRKKLKVLQYLVLKILIDGSVFSRQ